MVGCAIARELSFTARARRPARGGARPLRGCLQGQHRHRHQRRATARPARSSATWCAARARAGSRCARRSTRPSSGSARSPSRSPRSRRRGCPELLAEARAAGARAEIVERRARRARSSRCSREDARAALHFPRRRHRRLDPADDRLRRAGRAATASRSAAARRCAGIEPRRRPDRWPCARRRRPLADPLRGQRGRAGRRHRSRSWPAASEFAHLAAAGPVLAARPRDRAAASRKVVGGVPTPHTRGIYAVPTTNRSLLLGPTADDREDRATGRWTPTTLDARVRRRPARWSPACAASMRSRRSRPTGPRPTASTAIGRDSRGREPGARGRHPLHRRLLLARHRRAGARPGRRDRAGGRRGAGRTRCAALRAAASPARAPAARSGCSPLDPRYGQVVCACEQVTAAEIAAAHGDGACRRARWRGCASAPGRWAGAARARCAWPAARSCTRCTPAAARGRSPCPSRRRRWVSSSDRRRDRRRRASPAWPARPRWATRVTVVDRIPVRRRRARLGRARDAGGWREACGARAAAGRDRDPLGRRASCWWSGPDGVARIAGGGAGDRHRGAAAGRAPSWASPATGRPACVVGHRRLPPGRERAAGGPPAAGRWAAATGRTRAASELLHAGARAGHRARAGRAAAGAARADAAVLARADRGGRVRGRPRRAGRAGRRRAAWSATPWCWPTGWCRSATWTAPCWTASGMVFAQPLDDPASVGGRAEARGGRAAVRREIDRRGAAT